MHAREGRVESAALNTGDWLLQNQDFQDWAQRKRFNQHHGFFWIQGNPGSGKSTLMKKAHSHVQAHSQDPTSVIAAFFFNARGSEMEKSPVGLFRTLLHSLCQHISALRAVVMKKYYRKRGLLNPSWEWQFFELKELLSSVVTAPVLGQRNLILCVDALDECDLIGAKSVIQFLEHLANSSIRENTKFNICLSSRYWPQFTIQHCFKARVEIENHGDIASYIHQSDQLAILETKLKDKAQGIFLWVVLVVQELLSAHENGATLGELDRILHRVPSDLWSFYQYQMENTGHDDRCQMLSMLQCVFYSQEPLSPTELRYLLAFGHEDFSSYSDWAQSNEYVMSDAHMEKRIREKSKGLVEIAEIPECWNGLKADFESKETVQFIHQTVKDFLSKDGFEPLRGREMPNDAASGHEFMKVACFNYLNTTDLQDIPILDFRLYSDDTILRKMPTLSEDHPLLEYAVDCLFLHAALAERHGIPQDSLRSHISDNTHGLFERWRYLNDLISKIRGEPRPQCIGPSTFDRGVQGPEARPLHIFAQYGLLVPGMSKPREDPNIRGGLYDYPLLAAAAQGHKDAVRYLLNLGADLQVSGPSEETAYHWATSQQHVEILKMLLEHPRSLNTLEQRILIASIQGRRNHRKKVHQITALLIPEVSIPISAIDPICSLIASYRERGPLVSLILDKCEAALLRHKSLLYACVANRRVRINDIQRLLNGLETIEICEELLDALHHRSQYPIDQDENEKIAMMLFERGDVEMTENFIDKLILLSNSSQLLSHLVTVGIGVPPLTCHQIMSGLSNGSPESVAFFVQHAPEDASSDEMLLAAIQNDFYSDQAVRVLLGLRNIDRVREDAVISCLQDRRHSLSMLKTFEDRWGTMAFSKNDVATMLPPPYSSDQVAFVLSRCERFSLTESIVCAASYYYTVIDLFLDFDPTFRVQDKLVAKTVTSTNGILVLETYVNHGKPLKLTEEVVRAAARNRNRDADVVDALDFILRHDSDAEISDTMVLEALRSPSGSGLITWMLESDPSICMQEDFLIAAASNKCEGALIFEALHQQGRISVSNPAVGATHAPPAKRQRVSLNPLPSGRVKRTKSAPITTKVIEAAAANRSEVERRRLLTLFQEWGVLTDEDRRLFRFSD